LLFFLQIDIIATSHSYNSTLHFSQANTTYFFQSSCFLSARRYTWDTPTKPRKCSKKRNHKNIVRVKLRAIFLHCESSCSSRSDTWPEVCGLEYDVTFLTSLSQPQECSSHGIKMQGVLDTERQVYRLILVQNLTLRPYIERVGSPVRSYRRRTCRSNLYQ
jgi:hypothetical protein